MSVADLPTAEERYNGLIRDNLKVDPAGLLDRREWEGAAEEAVARDVLRKAERRWRLVDEKTGLEVFDSKGFPGTFTEALLEGWDWATFEDTEEVLAYAPARGIYLLAEAKIKELVEWAIPKEATNHLVKEVLGHVQRSTFASRDAFNPRGQLCLLNGVLDLETLELRSHASIPGFTRALPVALDPEAIYPRFERFLEEILPNEGHRKVVQMLFGYCLEAGNWLQRAFMFAGSGNNGKSTLAGVLEDLLGPEGVSTLTLQQIAGDRFTVAELYGKLANVCADIPNAPLRYSTAFKMLTGRDVITAQRKYQHPFQFLSEAVLVFSANELPPVDDRTVAFWRRWILLPFTVDFKGREDRRLSERLRTELPGILNWAMEGLRMLRERGDFPEDLGADSLKEEWMRRSDSIYWFMQECVEVDPKKYVIKADLYQAYREFCEARDLSAKPQETFHGKLQDYVHQARAQRVAPSIRKSRPWAWYGVTLREGEG